MLQKVSHRHLFSPFSCFRRFCISVPYVIMQMSSGVNRRYSWLVGVFTLSVFFFEKMEIRNVSTYHLYIHIPKSANFVITIPNLWYKVL